MNLQIETHLSRTFSLKHGELSQQSERSSNAVAGAYPANLRLIAYTQSISRYR